jgi:AhpD family alkylhydroperoxidase
MRGGALNRTKSFDTMQERIRIDQAFPEAFQGLYALSMTVSKSGLPAKQKHLISIRTSQLNGCAFCLDIHTKEALQDGESLQRIVLLDAWRESGLYDNEERAILALTEEVTRIGSDGVSDETYAQAAALFSREVLARILMSIVIINAWNRIAISTRLPVSPWKAGQPA